MVGYGEPTASENGGAGVVRSDMLLTSASEPSGKGRRWRRIT